MNHTTRCNPLTICLTLVLFFFSLNLAFPGSVKARKIDRKIHIFIDISKTTMAQIRGSEQPEIVEDLFDRLLNSDFSKLNKDYDTLVYYPFAENVNIQGASGKQILQFEMRKEIREIVKEIEEQKEATKRQKREAEKTDIARLFRELNRIVSKTDKDRNHQNIIIVLSDFLNSEERGTVCDFGKNDGKITEIESEIFKLIQASEKRYHDLNSLPNLHFRFFKLEPPVNRSAKDELCIQITERIIWDKFVSLENIGMLKKESLDVKSPGHFLIKLDTMAEEEAELITEGVSFSVNKNYEYSIDLNGRINLSLEFFNPNDHKIGLSQFQILSNYPSNSNNSVEQFKIANSHELAFDIDPNERVSKFVKIQFEEGKPDQCVLNFNQNPLPKNDQQLKLLFEFPPLIPKVKEHTSHAKIQDLPFLIEFEFHDNSWGYNGYKSVSEYFEKYIGFFDFFVKSNRHEVPYGLIPDIVPQKSETNKLSIRFGGSYGSLNDDDPNDHLFIKTGKYSLKSKAGTLDEGYLLTAYREVLSSKSSNKKLVLLVLYAFLIPFTLLFFLGILCPYLKENYYYSLIIVPSIFGIITVFDHLNSNSIAEMAYFVVGWIPLSIFCCIIIIIAFEKRHIIKAFFYTDRHYKLHKSGNQLIQFISYFFWPLSKKKGIWRFSVWFICFAIVIWLFTDYYFVIYEKWF